MLTEGTKSRSSIQIAEEIDRFGAATRRRVFFRLSGNVVLSASGLSDNFDEWFESFADVLLNPSFPAGRAGEAQATPARATCASSARRRVFSPASVLIAPFTTIIPLPVSAAESRSNA